MMRLILALASALILSVATGCQPTTTDTRPHIVVTYAVLGSLVKELVGDAARVTISVPNGLDPHEWEPSARDIEAINRSDLVVQNGLGLEGGLEKALAEAQKRGVKFFTATDYVEVRHVGEGEGVSAGDPDQQTGAPDPHLWTDPLTMKRVFEALAREIKNALGLDVASRAAELATRFDRLNDDITSLVAAIPQANRKLVTGHESLGYFARRYNFHLIGAIIPGLSSQAEVSAADLAALKQVILENQVKVVFTELGTPAAVAAAVSRETDAWLVEINTHLVPEDGSYFTLMLNLAETIVEALK